MGLALDEMRNEVMKMAVKGNRNMQLMPLRWSSLGCAALLSMHAGNANGKDAAPQVVWARAGVSYSQYRGDALECGMRGLASNIDDSKPVKTLARASSQLEAIDVSAQTGMGQGAGPTGQSDLAADAANRANQEQRIITAARPDQQYAGIKTLMFQVVRRCMTDLGYAKIILTEKQRKDYDGIKGGAEARRAYIYTLASDPHVLETQREAAAQ